MRELGVRRLVASCLNDACQHHSVSRPRTREPSARLETSSV
jgi:hypothetical protein